jgi:hypothetical protein
MASSGRFISRRDCMDVRFDVILDLERADSHAFAFVRA